MKKILILLVVVACPLSTSTLFAKVKFVLDSIPAGAILTVDGANVVRAEHQSAQAPSLWISTPPKGKNCETYTVKAHWVSGAETSRQVTVCDGTKNQTYHLTRPYENSPEYEHDWNYGKEYIQRQEASKVARDARSGQARQSLGQTIAAGIAGGLANAQHTYSLVDMKTDNEHGITYCYYRGMNGGFVEQHPTGSLAAGCPYSVTR